MIRIPIQIEVLSYIRQEITSCLLSALERRDRFQNTEISEVFYTDTGTIIFLDEPSAVNRNHRYYKQASETLALQSYTCEIVAVNRSPVLQKKGNASAISFNKTAQLNVSCKYELPRSKTWMLELLCVKKVRRTTHLAQQ